MRVSVADAQGEATSVHGRSIKDVTPSDTVDLSIPGYLMIDNNGADGDIAFIPFDNVDSEVILLSYAKGDDPKPYLVRRVMATSTTATGIKVVY